MKKKLFAITMAAILLAPSALQAKVQHLLPKPQQITATENVAAFALGGTVTINYSDGAEKCDLLEEFFTTNGCTLAESGGMAVNVSLVQSIDGAYDYELYGYENEAYTLDVTSSGIINLADGTYITTSGNPLECVETQPMAGWSIKKAETTGNVIVVSGTNQFNQQKDGSYNLLNWGNGTNTTDDGCEYRMVDVTESIPPQPTVTLERLSSQPYPYAIDDALAAKVFAKENITIALDVTMPASMSDNTRYALVCAADPTNAVTGATKTNSPYVAYGLNGSNPAYLPSSASGDKFTYRDFAFTGNMKYKVVYVIDRTNKKFSIYVDGVLKSSADYPVLDYELQSFSNFATNANAKLYIGGGVVSSNASYDKFSGKVHSVQFFDSALTPEQIADIEWPGKVLVIRNEVDGLAENNPNTHFGSLRATTSAGQTLTKLKRTSELTEIIYDNTEETTIDFTRAYRGFKFLGYYAGEQNLGKSFTITEELKNSITEENPLVAEFAPTNEATLFYDDDEFSYRIPAIATTGTGRLIAVSDYRHSLDDIGRYNFGTANPGIDLVIRTSDDNGKTWSATKTIAAGSGTRGSNDCAYGDAAIAVVGEKVLVMGAAGDVMFGNGSATAHNRTVRILSEDNGATWTAPQDISETLFIGDGATIKNGYTAFFGSGKLAVDENYNATGKARIYGAMLIKKEGVGNAIYVIYTDDLGVSWSILGGSQTHVTTNDEPKVEILPSGQILLSVRRGGGRQFNVFTYTDKATNAGSWANNVNGCGNGGSNTCNGEIFCIDAKKADGSAVKLLLQSQPKGGSGLYDRRNVTIWYKEVTDAAYTSEQIAADWTEGLQVSTQLSSYSTMSLQKDGKIAFFFEEAPCYGDDFTKGYCMVYIPLTIENITKGNFFSPDTDLNAERTVNVVLTDAEGNEYHDQLTCAINGIATAVTTKYPFITLGDNASLSLESEEYTYTNSVTLPFKVSNVENTVWHNVYFPSAGSAAPVYLSANEQNGEKVNTCVTNNVAYGNSTYNTYSKADNISWAIYSVDNGFTFKFKNKLTDKYIKVSGVANGNAQNAVYADEASATAFELVPDVASYNGDYALKAAVGETMGYLCATSWNYGYATHYQGNSHQGAWVKIVEAPDYAILIAEVNEVLSLLGDGLGKYTPAEADEETLEAAKTAMADSSNVKLNDLNSYKTLLDNATLNMPKEGQFFRIAYDYGGNAGKLYMQGVASTVKGVQFSDETGIASIWVYRDGALYSHHADRCLREVGNDRGLQAAGGKTTATFSTSIRVKGKYNIACTSYIHANSSGTNYFSDHCSTNNCPAHDLILEEVATVECSIGEHKIGTFYANDAMIIPDGIKAYVAITEPEMNEGTGIIRMTLVEDGIIPAKTGTVLRANEGTYTFTPAKTDGTTNTDGNLLIGYAGNAEYKEVTLPTDGSTNYVLTVKNGVAGFYRKAAGFKVYNNKAYLNVPNTVEARALYFNFDDDATGIVETESEDVKEEIYDLSGRRVQKVRKGIYIMDGKKILK